MDIIDNICEILSGYSEEYPINYADLYKILITSFNYSDEDIDEALKYMFQNKIISARGQSLTFVIWLN